MNLSFREYFASLKREKKPFFLKTRGVLLLFLGVVFIEFLFLANFAGKISLENFLASIAPEKLVELTNIRREERELKTLVISPLLMEAAQLKANDMAEKGYFAHTCPDGVTPWHWFDKVGYGYRYAGENLAVNFTEAHQVDKAWMESPTHKKNIVNERFQEIGIATATGEYKGREAIFVVQLFGTKPQIEQVVATEPLEEAAVATRSFVEDFPEETVEDKEEVILGEEEEIEEEETAEIAESVEEKEESFAFIEKTEEEPVYVVGAPEEVIVIEEEEPKYVSFWSMVVSSSRKVAGFVLFVVSGIFLFLSVLKLFFMEKVNVTFMAANGIVFLAVIFSALLINHYIFLLTEYI